MKRVDGGTWAWIALAALALTFLVVAQRLFADRYATGDVFPAYSSWASGADGTRALYRALDALDTLRVERNVRPLSRLAEELEPGPGTTILLAGLPAWRATTAAADLTVVLDRMARSGARVVIALAPEGRASREEAEVDDEEEQGETRDNAAASRFNGLGRWGSSLVQCEEGEARFAGSRISEGLPAALDWPSNRCLELSSEAWTVLYATAKGPVLVERPLGDGSLALMTGNHFLTNRGQAGARQTALLARLVGESRRVVFEESHLGIVASPGVVSLALGYRLHGVGVALLVVMVLAAWRGASSLMPAMERLAPGGIEARSSREGLVALLRRGIGERDLLRVCVRQWSAGGKRDTAGLAEIARSADPVEGYRRLSRLVQGKRRSRR